MKKVALLLSLMLSTAGCAHANDEDIQNVPPTYDFEEGDFMVDLPLFCEMDGTAVLDVVNSQGYKLVFLAEQKSMAGSMLYVTVFLHPERRDFYIFLTNKDTGAICEVTSGALGNVYPLTDIENI